ncbi:anthranilate synthase component I family protein [Helicovermis profundi]|uniref:Anthranilate synthase component 1 n=1 Tax=Helicovermis profundi TaxID=3065157 RepID=A0AAU9ELF1_9FIRM|nr:anthranilate synthase component I [Clostridia bacterium S502]
MEVKTNYKIINGKNYSLVEIYENLHDNLSFIFEGNKGKFSYFGRNPIGRIVSENDELNYYKYSDKSPFESEIKEGNVFENLRKYLEFNFYEEKLDHVEFKGGYIGFVSYDSIKNIEEIKINNKKDIDIPEIDLMLYDEVICYDNFKNDIYIIVNSYVENSVQYIDERIDKIEDEIRKIKCKTNFKIKIKLESENKENTHISLNGKENEKINNIDISNIKFLTSKSKFIDNVKLAKEYIKNGDIFQVVLSRKAVIKCEEKGFNIYKKLRKVNFSDYMFYINFGTYEVLGSSPEILAKKIKNKIYSCPIAGTRKRGISDLEDKNNESELLNDSKEKSEHNMLVDLSRNDIGRVSKFGKVSLKKYMNVEKFSYVMHLVSLVEGELKDGLDSIDVLTSCMPAGTVSGAPKIRAMEIIEELEENRRGFYAGGVGFFSFDGNMDLCIAIRSALIKGGEIFVQAGAGIVAESTPEKEFIETEDKLKSIITALKMVN